MSSKKSAGIITSSSAGLIADPVHVSQGDQNDAANFVSTADNAGSVSIADGNGNFVAAATSADQQAAYRILASDYTSAANHNLAAAASSSGSARTTYDNTAYGQNAEAAAFNQAANAYVATPPPPPPPPPPAPVTTTTPVLSTVTGNLPTHTVNMPATPPAKDTGSGNGTAGLGAIHATGPAEVETATFHVSTEDKTLAGENITKTAGNGAVSIADGNGNFVKAAANNDTANLYENLSQAYGNTAQENLRAAGTVPANEKQQFDNTAYGQNAEAAAFNQAYQNYENLPKTTGTTTTGLGTVMGNLPDNNVNMNTGAPVSNSSEPATTVVSHGSAAGSAGATGSAGSGSGQSSSASGTLGTLSHKIVPGDTLYGIAKKYGVSLSALEAANPTISDPNLIFPGHYVNVPGSGPKLGAAVGSGGTTEDSALNNILKNATIGGAAVDSKDPVEGVAWQPNRSLASKQNSAHFHRPN